jgi:hypothetical protein
MRRSFYGVYPDEAFAHGHLRAARADTDLCFQFAEAPWTADGKINPRGVPFGYASDMILEKGRQLEDYDARGFACRKCAAVVRATPVQFQGAVEPVDWWWCKACKDKGSDVAKTLKAKKALEAAAGCMRLETVWTARS